MNSENRSRRDFLKPESFGKLLAAVSGSPEGAPPPAQEGPRSGALCRLGVDSMATRFEILFESIDFEHAPAAERGLELILALEAQMTVYREDSEISHLNRGAFEASMEVESRLFELLHLSRRLWEETGGAFDIALHELLKVWGVYKGPTRVPAKEELQAAREASGFDKVELDPEDETVRFLHPRTGLNLAAIGKGYALDRVGEKLRGEGMEHFLLHGGQSSLLASGATTWEAGWLINLVHPFDYSLPVARILLRDCALSTSVLIPEKARTGPVSGHILDPRTGLPVSHPLLSVSVMSASAAEAEALSTAFLVMGLDKALEYCEKHPLVGAVFTLNQEDSEALDIRICGPAQDRVEVLS